MDLVRCVRWDPPRSARAEISSLVADPERHRPADDQPELLVLVAVLRDDAVGIELDHGERAEVSFDGTRDDAIPDSNRSNAGEVVESAHVRNCSLTLAPLYDSISAWAR